MANGVLTNIGKKKICMAHAGDVALPTIAEMAFGDGGIGTDGVEFDTTGQETELRSELLRKPIDGHTYPESATCSYRVRLSKSDLAGSSISELGLIDEEGDLVAYKTFPPKGKGNDEEFEFEIKETL